MEKKQKNIGFGLNFIGFGGKTTVFYKFFLENLKGDANVTFSVPESS